jgi:thymidylate synthase
VSIENYNPHDKEYFSLLNHILKNGVSSEDRTKTGCLSTFGGEYTFDLTEGFPLITTKKVHWKSVVGELLWMLSGSTNAKELKDKFGVSIWDEWAKPEGQLGPVYGAQWRRWQGNLTYADCIIPHEREEIDQIANVIEEIKDNPNSRRLIVSAWNPADIPDMALPPCHAFFQFYVRNNKLSCKLTQRSADAFLGVPFNIASYALLTHMIAQICGLGVDKLIMSFGDLHIYNNHIEQVKEQLSRSTFAPPSIRLNQYIKDIDLFTVDDIRLDNYISQPAIKAEVAV